jgi:iron complex outermembrane receptor protein
MSSRFQTSCTRSLLACTTALYMLVQPSVAFAQEAQSADEGTEEAIVITGSRIQRRDYEANSPIVTVNENLLKDASSAAIEQSLNKLPQFTPVQTPALGGDIQATATNTPGAATISLRGLGTNRTLVLMDGRRATPGNASMVVDINTIPSAAVERVEIITGGASATYGADAVAGVVNFIMKKNFQGLQLDARAGVSQHGDGFEYEIGGVMGTNFDDGRGNISIAFATNDRKSARRADRDWFVDAWKNPKYGANEFFPTFSGYQPIAGNNPSNAAMGAIFGTDANGNSRVGLGERLYFNTDGTAFTGFFQSSDVDGVSRFKGDLTGTKWKKTVDGLLGQNFQDELLVLPLNRFNVYTRGNYEINDWIGVFAQGMFSKVQTRTVQQPSPSVNGWAATVPNDGRALPTELQSILNSRADPTANWQLTYYLDFMNRESRVDVFTYNIQAGFEGKIPGTDWTWEVYGSHGESETSSLTTGTASLERFRAIIAAPNWGAGFRAQGNPTAGGFGASAATCTSGFNPFNKAAVISQDCIDAIRADLKTRAVMQQTVWEANAQGGLFELPAGTLRAAIGASHRQNRYEFLNDTLTTQGSSFLDQTIGIYPSGNSRGVIKADELYGELLVPVLADLPFVKKWELELGARTSHYNTTGSSFTWKIMGDWQVNDWLRFRGGYNKAERSPNVAELYLAPQQTFAAAGGGDVCALSNGRSWSANPVNANAANVRAVCEILMNKANPATSQKYYSDPTFYINNGFFTFAFPSVAGNASIKPETADTWTLGTVITSPFESEMFRTLRLSVDYYNIRVKDAIGVPTLDTAQQLCFDPRLNPAITGSPAAAAATPACAAIGRVAGDGALGNVITFYQNLGRFRTTGLDVQLDWAFDVGPGRFSLNSVFNYLIKMKSAGLPLPVGTLVEYAGSLGPQAGGVAGVGENGINPGAFRWRMLNTFGYSIGGANVSLQWQHLPGAKSATLSPTRFGTPAYDLFNLSGSYAITKDATIRFGIDNIFDKAPPETEYLTNPPANTLSINAGGSPYNAFFYDLNGRRFYMGATFKF